MKTCVMNEECSLKLATYARYVWKKNKENVKIWCIPWTITLNILQIWNSVQRKVHGLRVHATI